MRRHSIKRLIIIYLLNIIPFVFFSLLSIHVFSETFKFYHLTPSNFTNLNDISLELDEIFYSAHSDSIKISQLLELEMILAQNDVSSLKTTEHHLSLVKSKISLSIVAFQPMITADRSRIRNGYDDIVKIIKLQPDILQGEAQNTLAQMSWKTPDLGIFSFTVSEIHGISNLALAKKSFLKALSYNKKSVIFNSTFATFLVDQDEKAEAIKHLRLCTDENLSTKPTLEELNELAKAKKLLAELLQE